MYDHFGPIIEAMRTGNLLLFESTLEYYNQDFINKDCYLLIDRLRLLVFVQLVRNILKVQLNMQNSKQQLIKTDAPQVIFHTTIQNANRLMNQQYFQSQWYRKFNSTYAANEYNFVRSMNNNNNTNSNQNTSNNAMDQKIEETTLSIDEIDVLSSSIVFKKLVKGYIAPKRCIVLKKGPDRFVKPAESKNPFNKGKLWFEWEF